MNANLRFIFSDKKNSQEMNDNQLFRKFLQQWEKRFPSERNDEKQKISENCNVTKVYDHKIKKFVSAKD